MRTDLWGLIEARAEADHSADGMVALIPSIETAQRYVLAGGETLDELHVTLQYLSEETVAALDVERLYQQITQIAKASDGPIEARVMGHATFNSDGGPTGEQDPCAVYLISDAPELGELAAAVQEVAPDPKAHRPFLCHMTAGYGFVAGDLSALGPIIFDRIRLAIAGQDVDFPL